LQWLVCPSCRGDLSLEAAAREAGESWDGELSCARCSARYAVTRGIPRLLPGALSATALATAERFGHEWTRFAEVRPEYEAQFLGWIAPLGRDIFRRTPSVGRRVRQKAVTFDLRLASERKS